MQEKTSEQTVAPYLSFLLEETTSDDRGISFAYFGSISAQEIVELGESAIPEIENFFEQNQDIFNTTDHSTKQERCKAIRTTLFLLFASINSRKPLSEESLNTFDRLLCKIPNN